MTARPGVPHAHGPEEIQLAKYELLACIPRTRNGEALYQDPVFIPVESCVQDRNVRDRWREKATALRGLSEVVRGDGPEYATCADHLASTVNLRAPLCQA